MSNVRKKLLLLPVLLLLLLLGGCHGSREIGGFSVPESFDSSRQYTVSFWAKNDTNKTQTEIYQQAIADFEQLYPNIKVELRLYNDYTKIYNDVITNIATGTTPNVCISYPDHIATYLTGNNVMVDLDALMDDARYGLGGSELLFDSPRRDEVISCYLEECRLGEHYYALPYMRSTEACYVNRDMVKKLGYELPEVLTWDFVWEVSEAAMQKDSEGNYAVNGQKVLIPFIYKSTDNMMIQMLHQLDAGYSDSSGRVLLFNDATEDILLDLAGHVKKGAFSTFKISSYPGNFLNAGQCIFAIDSTAGSSWMGTHAPNSDIHGDSIVDFELAVLPVPQYDTEHPQMISQGPSICLFNKEDEQEVLASWLFMQYLLTDKVQIAYAQTEGYVPVTAQAQESPEYQDYLSRAGEDNSLYYQAKLDATRLLLDNTDNTFTTAVFNGSASVRNAAGQLIENVTKSVRRRETVDAAYMQQLFSDVTSLYRLDQLSLTVDGSADLGPLPRTAAALLWSLGAVWLLILLFLLRSYLHKKRNKAS